MPAPGSRAAALAAHPQQRRRRDVGRKHESEARGRRSRRDEEKRHGGERKRRREYSRSRARSERGGGVFLGDRALQAATLVSSIEQERDRFKMERDAALARENELKAALQSKTEEWKKREKAWDQKCEYRTQKACDYFERLKEEQLAKEEEKKLHLAQERKQAHRLRATETERDEARRGQDSALREKERLRAKLQKLKEHKKRMQRQDTRCAVRAGLDLARAVKTELTDSEEEAGAEGAAEAEDSDVESEEPQEQATAAPGSSEAAASASTAGSAQAPVSAAPAQPLEAADASLAPAARVPEVSAADARAEPAQATSGSDSGSDSSSDSESSAEEAAEAAANEPDADFGDGA